MSWDPGRYLVFQEERERPALDLLARIPEGVFRAVDLGCGPGNSTELLQRRFPGAAVLGVDSSSEMIETARRRLPGIPFEISDIADWRGEDAFDLIFANAALQWVPDHAALLPRLLGQLAPGGALALQMPDNLDEPTHRAMREVAANGPWTKLLTKAVKAREPRRDAGWYFELLRGAGASPEVWRTTYHHPLAGAEAVVEWFRSTGLRPYLDPLDADMREGFLDAYREAIARAYPTLSDGTILLPFPRLFLLARV
jgi:trans-aconitate 2-methyltransferase